MREILFRGKRSEKEWVYGNLTTIGDVCFISEGMGFNKNVIPETVGQYTGLTGKNGQKIFEGDIVIRGGSRGWWNRPVEVILGVGHFDSGVIKYNGWTGRDIDGDVEGKAIRSFEEYDEDEKWEAYEVLGNIHENPELLGGEEE